MQVFYPPSVSTLLHSELPLYRSSGGPSPYSAWWLCIPSLDDSLSFLCVPGAIAHVLGEPIDYNSEFAEVEIRMLVSWLGWI